MNQNGDDRDMKIMPDKPSKVFDLSEGAANAFAREKANGNMSKAREIGQQFADELAAGAKGVAMFAVGAYDTEDTLRHRQVLYSFIVSHVIEDMCPNSIVAQSALSAFNETVQEKLPQEAERISDTGVLSLYILAARMAPDDYYELGRVFAECCGHKDDEIYIGYGSELAAYYANYCTQVILRAQLVR